MHGERKTLLTFFLHNVMDIYVEGREGVEEGCDLENYWKMHFIAV